MEAETVDECFEDGVVMGERVAVEVLLVELQFEREVWEVLEWRVWVVEVVWLWSDGDEMEIVERDEGVVLMDRCEDLDV